MTAEDGDRAFMAQAFRLARRGINTTDPNPRVGCVIVAAGEIVGEGWHQRAGEAHAEVIAIAEAGGRASGATAFVTLEPCCHDGRTPPCTRQLIEAGIGRVVFAADDPNPDVAGKGAAELRAAGVEVTDGLLDAATRGLNPGFFSRMERKRPWVRSKLAISVDGRTALANNDSEWISSAESRRDVQCWRARSSAILTGVGTVIADDPSLNVRDADLGDVEQPVRVVVDSQLRMPADSRMLKLAGETIIFCADEPGTVGRQLSDAGARVERLPADNGRVSLDALMQRLSDLEINELMVEAGPVLNGALLAAGLIDEYLVYMASHILGTGARGMFDIPTLTQMSDRIELKLTEVRRIGDDCRLRFSPALS